MTIYCAFITSRGGLVAKRVASALGATLYVPEALSREYGRDASTFSSVREFFEVAFKEATAIICVMACGIVVRGIKDLLRSKTEDPAVVVVDEGAQFAISLVSGHLGGANELTRRVAAILGAQPVITTATDTRGLPAFDDMARELRMEISHGESLKKVHMAMLEGGKVVVHDNAGIFRRYLGGAGVSGPILLKGPYDKGIDVEGMSRNDPWCEVMITLDHLLGQECSPFHKKDILVLRPQMAYFLGIGCNSGTSADEIIPAIENTFKIYGLDLRLLGVMATIDKKRGEQGLIEAAKRLCCPMVFFSKEELADVAVPNPSQAPMRAVGSPSVAEASAILATRGKGTLVVEKQKIGNLTLAIASLNALVDASKGDKAHG